MKRFLFTTLAIATIATSAFGASATLNCTPTAITNSSAIAATLFFTNASGTGSFSCSDASLGALTLSSVTISILTDYTKGNGTASDSNDNSAGFTFTGDSTWAAAHPAGFTSTMNLATGLTTFTVGNLSSQASMFTNTTSGGLGGTAYVQPLTDAENALTDSNTINVSAFVDAGGFGSGVSDASVSVTYSYTSVTTSSPEPMSMFLFGGGLIGLSLFGRSRRLSMFRR